MKSRSEARILVVEDEAPMARAIADSLSAEGFHVVVAGNGQQGMKKLEEDIFDVVLLDIAMPKVDGMEMMKQVRETEKGREIPIIIYTNLVPDNDIIQGVSRDKPVYYFSKTEHDIDFIIKTLDEIISV